MRGALLLRVFFVGLCYSKAVVVSSPSQLICCDFRFIIARHNEIVMHITLYATIRAAIVP